MQRSHGVLGSPTSYPKDVKVNLLPPDRQKYFMEGPMKSTIEKWWLEGTTKECLLSAGANLKHGYLQPTSKFVRMSELSFGTSGR
eukprot:3804239-Prorocentrum_lima.AAC.1